MAEYLIYNTEQWMGKLTPEQLIEYRAKYPDFQRKYDARYKNGDVVEVRPDGYWTSPLAKGFNKKVFKIVSVPGEFVDKQMSQPLLEKKDKNKSDNDITNYRVIKRGSHYISNLNIESIEILNTEDFKNRLRKKTK